MVEVHHDDWVHYGEAVAGPLTVRTVVHLGPEVANSQQGVWLAGLSAAQGEKPVALAITLSQIDSGWFGPVWGVQLQSDLGLIPESLSPRVGTGFLKGSHYVPLLGTGLTWDRDYAVDLGFDPDTGLATAVIKDMMQGTTVLSRMFKLRPVAAPLYPAGGVGTALNTKDANVQPIAMFKQISVENAVLPLVNWSIQQRVASNEQYVTAERLNRERETVVLVWPGESQGPGTLRLSMLNQQRDLVLQVSAIELEYTPLNLSALAAGVYLMQLQYVIDGQVWIIDEKHIVVGTASTELENLRAQQAGDGQLALEGTLRVSQDGPHENIRMSLAAEIVAHDFSFDERTRQGTMRVESVGTAVILDNTVVESGTTANIPFSAIVPLPVREEPGTIWELRLTPSADQQHFLVANQVSTWLGQSVRDSSWSGFLADETETRTQLAPGIEIVHLKGQLPAGPVSMHLVVTDLTHPNVTVNTMLGADPYTSLQARWPRSAVSEMVERDDATVGVNANFFAIHDTMTPLGLLVRSGEILATGSRDEAIVFTEDGTPYVGSWEWEGRLLHPGGSEYRVITGLNTADPGENITMYRLPMHKTPGSTLTQNDVVELVVSVVSEEPARGLHESGAAFRTVRGVVQEVRRTAPPTRLEPGTFVLSGSEAHGRYMAGTFQVGDEIEVQYRLVGRAVWPHTLDWQDIHGATAGGIVILRNGLYASRQVETDRDRRPRTAVGISFDQRRLYMAVVDGRSSTSVGMTYRELADFFRRVGAFHVLNLDGGGSTTLAVRSLGEEQARVLNVPSDGKERLVADGLGLFYSEKE